jgi:hypothetical protein
LVRRKDYVSIIDSNDDDDDDDDDVRRFCENCLQLGMYNRLGAQIVNPGEEKPDDWNRWLQCYVCGTKYAKYQTKQTEIIETGIQNLTEENPHESGSKETIVMGIAKRTSKEGKRISEKKRKDRTRKHHPDKEIDEAIHRFGEDNVKIVKDSTAI